MTRATETPRCRRCGDGRVVELIEFDARADGPPVTPPQIGYLLGVSQKHVREMVNAGAIRGARVGRDKYRVAWRSMRSYLFKIGMLPLLPSER